MSSFTILSVLLLVVSACDESNPSNGESTDTPFADTETATIVDTEIAGGDFVEGSGAMKAG